MRAHLQRMAQAALASARAPSSSAAGATSSTGPARLQAMWSQHNGLQVALPTWHQPQGACRWAHQQGGWRAYQRGYENAKARSHRKIADTGMYLGAVVLGMLGVSYGSVPLYRMFCQATGYGGALKPGHSVEEKLRQREANPNAELEAKAAKREMRVWFTADCADDMPWRFTPTQEFVRVRPGQSVLVFFKAENLSDKPITGVSTYNVVPDKAAYYFNKIQCFCFEEQRLREHEAVDMPVFFYIDPEIVQDHNCRSINDITLSYTFFKVQDEDLEDQTATASTPEEGSGVRLHGSGVLPAGIAAPAPAVAQVVARAAVQTMPGIPAAIANT